MSAARKLFVAIVLFYTVLGFLVLSPAAVYSGDIGVKFVQARSLAAQRFTSLDLQYPGGFLDPAREFFPIRPPFIIEVGSETQAIFSPVAAIVQSAAVSLAGIAGMVITSLIAAAAILHSATRMIEPRLRPALLLALGLGSPLWFYAISGWEHAPAVAFSTAAFAVGITSRVHGAPLIAGVLLGIGATLRDEVLLLLPGLLLMIRLARGGLAPLALATVGTVLPLAAAAIVEVGWFNRPAAAHLRHAVHLLQSAARLTDAPNPEVPALAPMTLRERYETVVAYWMLGYGKPAWVVSYTLGFLVALAIRWRYRSSAGILVWLVAVAAFAVRDAWELLTAPKWLAGLQRVSPFLVCALLPRPSSVVRPGSAMFPWFPAATVLTTVVYLIVAFAGVDTSGGKSLGPRLLLPLFPILAVAAIARIDDFRRGAHWLDRSTGMVGVALVVMAISIHVAAVRAYHHRNSDDLKIVQAVRETPHRIVVADNEFTAQLLFTLYYRKILLLADNEELGARLGAHLAAARIPAVVLVTRYSETNVALPPYRRQRTELRGRMTIQYWTR